MMAHASCSVLFFSFSFRTLSVEYSTFRIIPGIRPRVTEVASWNRIHSTPAGCTYLISNKGLVKA
jgi:hypothetical protein